MLSPDARNYALRERFSGLARTLPIECDPATARTVWSSERMTADPNSRSSESMVTPSDAPVRNGRAAGVCRQRSHAEDQHTSAGARSARGARRPGYRPRDSFGQGERPRWSREVREPLLQKRLDWLVHVRCAPHDVRELLPSKTEQQSRTDGRHLAVRGRSRSRAIRRHPRMAPPRFVRRPER